MRFDSHLYAVMTAAVGLVNALTSGESGGRTMVTPTGPERVAVVRTLLTSRDGGRPRLAERDAVALTAVASRLRQVFEQVEAGAVGSAAATVNDLLRDSGARPQLDHDLADGWNVHFHGRDDTVVLGWTAGCASGLALALGSDLAGRLGVCAAERCDRVYVDASRNGAKRFCSTTCQSRAKAAAFRARRSPGGPELEEAAGAR